MRAMRWLLLVALLAFLGGRAVNATELEGFDGDDEDDEVQSYQVPPTPKVKGAGAGGEFEEAGGEGEEASGDFGRNTKAEGKDGDTEEPPKPKGPPKKYYAERACFVLLGFYVLLYFRGKRKNQDLVVAWAEKFCMDDGLFDRNFSLIGPGQSEGGECIIKESASEFKFYASGRRFCTGLLATLDLVKRQDLLSVLYYLINPRDDYLNVEVYMNDKEMDPAVFCIARRKLARAMHKDVDDLKMFASLLDVPQNLRGAWPGDELTVLSESRDLVEDLVTPELMAQVFGPAAWAKAKPWFESIHISDQLVDASHKKQIRFRFRIPPKDRMSEMEPLMAMVPYMIDVVGRYRLAPQQGDKAKKVRLKQEEEKFKSTLEDRKEQLRKKKEQERVAAREREAKLTGTAAAKAEKARMKKEAKMRQPKMKTMKM